MAVDYEKLGLRIKYNRIKKGGTQEAFSELILTTRQHLAMIEIGRKMPSLDLLVDIANALDVSADDLLVDSLKHSSSTADTTLHQLLLDCNETEEKVLIELVKYMKGVLYSLGI